MAKQVNDKQKNEISVGEDLKKSCNMCRGIVSSFSNKVSKVENIVLPMREGPSQPIFSRLNDLFSNSSPKSDVFPFQSARLGEGRARSLSVREALERAQEIISNSDFSQESSSQGVQRDYFFHGGPSYFADGEWFRLENSSRELTRRLRRRIDRDSTNQ